MDLFARENNFKPRRIHAGRAGGAAAAPVEGEHPRAAQHGRAADHHGAGRHRSTWTTCPRPCGLTRGRRRPIMAADEPAAAARGRRHACGSSRKSSERTFLVEKLRENGWNISRTAEVIGTPRSNLYKKLESTGSAQESRTADAARSRRRLTEPPQTEPDDRCLAVVPRRPRPRETPRGRGKSELRRAVRRVTPGQGNLKESGTENIPPDFAPSALRRAGPRVCAARRGGQAHGLLAVARRAEAGKGEKVR